MLMKIWTIESRRSTGTRNKGMGNELGMDMLLEMHMGIQMREMKMRRKTAKFTHREKWHEMV